MQTVKSIKESLLSLTLDLKQELYEKPFFLVNEFDLEGYLYSRLILKEEFREPFLDIKRRPNYRIHLEYPRYFIQQQEPKVKGRYDIAILRKENTTRPPLEEDRFDMKLVWLGFELKLHWGESRISNILEGFRNDLPAFKKRDDKGNFKISSDYGALLHVNVAKEKPINDDLAKIEDKMKKYRREVPIPIFLVYVESYKERKEPEIRSVPNILQ